MAQDPGRARGCTSRLVRQIAGTLVSLAVLIALGIAGAPAMSARYASASTATGACQPGTGDNVTSVLHTGLGTANLSGHTCSSNKEPQVQVEAKVTAAQTVPGAVVEGSTENAKWSGKELLYGGNIGHYPGVTYQPDVVVIGGGANAIRGVSSDSLTWTIDGSAPGASQLHVGSVMLATTLASGRVVKLVRKGPDLQVTVVPATLTDIIDNGTFAADQPVPLSHPLVFSSALPSAQNENDYQAGRRAVFPASTEAPAADQSSGMAGAGASSFKLTPFCCNGDFGIGISYNSADGRFEASVRLIIHKPTVTYSITIAKGQLVQASLKLNGASDLSYYFFGATLNSNGDVKSVPIEVPGAFTVPLVGPLSLTLSQSFLVSMQLAGKATLKSSGLYKFHGSIGFSYGKTGNKPDPAGMSTEVPMDKNTLSLGVGENAITLAWDVRVTVGLGVGGLAVGAWAQLTPSLSLVADGGSLTSLKFGCVTLSLVVTSKYGAGWSIPEYIAKPVNAVLHFLNIKPIPRTGGPSWGPYEVWEPAQDNYCPPRKN
jgi:hypothetical protein